MKSFTFILTVVASLLLASCGSYPGPGSSTVTYTIGGTVSGLSGTGLVLQINGGNNLSVSANGSFSFIAAFTSGGPYTYTVTVLTQPSSPAQTCVVTNGSGTASANVTNIQVTCTTNTYTIGGTVSGLSGTGLVLRNNGVNNLSIGAKRELHVHHGHR